MHEIVVLSGKGGAGKTSVTAALARAMSVCDYDVDAPDLHILLKPETEMRADFVSGHLAVFNSDNCIDCAQCLAFCRFDAIKQAAPCEYPVIEQLCEGCAVCVKLCPELAFDFVPRHCGEYYRSRTRFGTMIHAELTPGAENSGRLILLLKQEAAKAAQADGAEIILSDGTPGIGCPVISSLSGAGLVCAVIEAGASGIADFKRLAELARRFRLPIAVIVNKADLSAEATEAAMQAARDAGAEVLGTLPFTPVFTEAMSRGEAVGETPSELDGHFQNFADRLLALVRGVVGRAFGAHVVLLGDRGSSVHSGGTRMPVAERLLSTGRWQVVATSGSTNGAVVFAYFPSGSADPGNPPGVRPARTGRAPVRGSHAAARSDGCEGVRSARTDALGAQPAPSRPGIHRSSPIQPITNG